MNLLAITVCVMVVATGDLKEGFATTAAPADTAEIAYCGVYALHCAFTALGRSVPFEDLVQSKYIGSRTGSSAKELAAACNDFGVNYEIIGGMNREMLSRLRTPAILHVKGRLDSGYNHWVLFMGTESGKVRIHDTLGPERLMSFEELAARWDGLALIVSTTRLNRLALQAQALMPAAAVAAVSLFMLGGCRYATNRLIAPIQQRLTFYSEGVIHALTILGASGLAYLMYSMCNPAGVISYRPAIAAIQEAKLSTFLKKLSAPQVAMMQHQDGVVFIDARQKLDFDEGHLPGSVNIPPSLALEQCRRRMAGIPIDRQLIVYCQSANCEYSRLVARMLLEIGYANIALFEGGWVEWQQSQESSL